MSVPIPRAVTPYWVAASKRTRDLDQRQNEAARELFRRLLKTRTQGELGAALGLTQTAVSGFISGRQGTSRSVVEEACALAGEDPAEVLGTARVLRLERYPNRAKAIAAHPDALPGAVRQLESLNLEAGQDPPFAWWAAKLASYDTALRTADALGPKVTERGDPLDD